MGDLVWRTKSKSERAELKRGAITPAASFFSDDVEARPKLVEQPSEEQARQISAQMRLPGDRDCFSTEAETGQTGRQIDARPDQREENDLPRENRRQFLFP